MTENKGKKFTDEEQAEELSLEDCGQVAGGGSHRYNTGSMDDILGSKRNGNSI